VRYKAFDEGEFLSFTFLMTKDAINEDYVKFIPRNEEDKTILAHQTS
jgi:hypothetical protein